MKPNKRTMLVGFKKGTRLDFVKPCFSLQKLNIYILFILYMWIMIEHININWNL